MLTRRATILWANVALVLAVFMGEVFAIVKPDVADFPDEYFAPVMRIWRGGLHPVYFPMMSFYAPAMLAAYFCEEGILTVFVFPMLFIGLLLFIYEFAFLGHHGSFAEMWQYSMPNPDSVLSNRGAVGGFGFGIYYFGTALFGAIIGDAVSWVGIDTYTGGLPSANGSSYNPRERTHNMVSLVAIFRRGCGGFLCPKSINDEVDSSGIKKAPKIKQTLEWDDGRKMTIDSTDPNGPLAMAAADQSVCTNACTATGTGNRITFGVLWDLLTIIFLVGLVTGPIRDAMRKVNILYDWFTLLVLLGVYVIIWIWYQPYAYGELLDAPAWRYGPTDPAADDRGQDKYNANNLRIYQRYYDKVNVLYPIFVYIFVAQLGFCIFSTIMWGTRAYEHAQMAQDANEARYIVQQNLMMEFEAVLIIFSIQLVFSVLQYCLIIKNVVKAPVGDGR